MIAPSPLASESVDASIEAIQRLSIVPAVLETVCQVTGMRFAAIARVTEDRWTACAVLDHLDFGLKPGSDLVLTSTICDEIRQHQGSVAFGDAQHHPVFSTHHTPRIYGLRSYVSVPIISDGRFFGTLCAIDSEPRDFDEGTIVKTLALFASLVASNLALESRAIDAEDAFRNEVDTGQLREQFLAVVGHDLRSPLQGARLVAEQLGDIQESPRGKLLVQHLSKSITRMSGLIDDIMDFARGRLGGGIAIHLQQRDDLQEVITAAVEEVCRGQPHCVVRIDGVVDGPVRFDGKRMRQLLANLLNNAVAHGDPTEAITVRCISATDAVDITVANQGTPIPEQILPRLFEPFVRPSSPTPSEGLGLGLYIAAEIAKGHAAVLTVASDKTNGTAFTIRLPRA